MTLIHGNLSESTQLEFSNEYQYDRFSMVFKSRRPGALDESSFSIERVNTGELGYDRLTVRRTFAYDRGYAWSQSNAYQVFVICI